MAAETSTLRRVFEDYVKKAREVLSWDFSDDELYRLIGRPSRAAQFARLVSDLHGTLEFGTLIATAAEYFTSFRHRPSRGGWHVALSQFFAESGIYDALYDSRSVDSTESFEKFITYFQRENELITVLVPLHGVHFPFKVLELDDFSIRRFTFDQLSTRVAPRNQVAEFEFEELLTFASSYWYLVFTVLEPLAPVGFIPASDPDNVLPPRAIQLLESYSLLEAHDPFGRELLSFSASGKYIGEIQVFHFSPRIHVPFVVKLRSDRGMLPLSTVGLVSRLIEDEEAEEQVDEHGDFVGVFPRSTMSFLEKDVESIRQCLSLHREIDALRKSAVIDSGFLSRALHFLYRAASSHDESESLLWNIMCLECLFGTKGSTVNSIARGIEHVYAAASESKQFASKYFKRDSDGLYDVRSRLIHGDIIPGSVDTRHVILSRQIARDAVEWSLNFLTEVASVMKQHNVQSTFTRENFISLIQIPVAERSLHKTLVENLF